MDTRGKNPCGLAGIHFSDIDICGRRGTDFAPMGSSNNNGSNEQLTLQLPAGEYYLAVNDMVQQQTRYSICIVKSTIACTPPGTPAPAMLAPAVRNAPSRAHHGDQTKPPAGFASPMWRIIQSRRP